MSTHTHLRPAVWRRTAAALACCERLSAITPLASPNPEKYALIADSLAPAPDA